MNKSDSSQVSYENFTRTGWYRELNRYLITLSGLKKNDRVLDAGAGTGSSTELICEYIDVQGEVIAIDRNRDYLDIAVQKLSRCPNVRFVEADILKAAEFIDGYLDGVFIFNAIHLIEEYRSLLKGLSGLLKPGGFIAINTTYFIENKSEFRRFQSELLLEIVREFIKEERAFSDREPIFIRSFVDYKKELINVGLEMVCEEIRDVKIDPRSLLSFYHDRNVVDYISSGLTAEDIKRYIIKPLRGLLDNLRRDKCNTLKDKLLYMVARKGEKHEINSIN